MDINSVVVTFAQEHPYYFMAANLVVGPLWPKAIDWAVTDGIDWVVPKVLSAQKFYLKRFGGTDEQIKAVERREAQALARASADVAADADAPAAPAPAPAPAAPPAP
jgi:hypothetical protein